MSMNLTILTTVAGCDTMIGEASREKTLVTNRKNQLALRLQDDVDTTGITQMLDYYPNKLANLQGLLDLNPPEEEVRRLNIEIAKTMKDQAGDERRMEKFGPYWKLLLEMEIEDCDSL